MARVRISDVAAAAGVSTSTVSLVLNDRTEARISAETRARVREAAAVVGYTPNSIARGLRTQRTRTIGLVSDVIATTPFAGRMLAGAQDAAREHGHLLILVNTDADQAVERDAIRALVDHQVDAMIFATMWHRVVETPEGIPDRTVFLDCRPTAGPHPAVVPDEVAGGRAAVRELVAAGHRRIGWVDIDEPNAPVASGLRHQAYLEVLAEAGITPDPAWHVRGEATTAASGRAATERLLDLPADRRPTAIFCFNDRMAAGAYVAARHRGLEIPADLSVVGYDDQQLVAGELDPPLTTIALPHYEMGRWATEVALGAREPPAPDQTYLMPCPIIRRDSVTSPPAAAPTPAGGGPDTTP